MEAWYADSVINTCSDFEKTVPLDNGKPVLYAMFGDSPVSQETLDKWVVQRGTFM
jgi:hypothetical protein